MSESPVEAVLRLQQADRLAVEFPHVIELLADLPDAEVARAGRLLAHADPDEIRREHPTIPVLTVAVTGHGTIAPLLLPPLRAEFARHGLALRPFVAGFSSYALDLGDPHSALYAAAPDLVLWVLNSAMVLDEVPVPWRPEDVEEVLAGKLQLVEQLADRFAATSRGTLILNTMPLAQDQVAQLVDYRSRARLGVIWRAANARLLDLAAKYPGTVVLDLDPLVAEGIATTDARLGVYSAAHLSPALLARYAREVGHVARACAGRTKKCLVLDLDGTMWGGVLGDDGAEGIEVAGTYRGEAFRALQRVVKQIGSQGVLLAVVTKNDPSPVRAVLCDHAGMTLHEDDFVRIVANWRPKHANITELADALNISVDSMVFVDDSAYECGLVRHELPGVTVIQVDDEPALNVGRLLRDGWFAVRELTAEDRARAERYRSDLDRTEFLGTFESVGDYLRELRITVQLTAATTAQVPRVSQITLRTNLFNLTATRLQPPDIRDLMDDPDSLVLAVRSSDRFGDNGLVGAVFLRRAADAWHIDNFLLSCRVLARGIEEACLAAVLRYAHSTGASAVYGTYRPTERNAKVRDFYPGHGFEPHGTDGPKTVFRHGLTDILAPPDHVRLVEQVGGGFA